MNCGLSYDGQIVAWTAM